MSKRELKSLLTASKQISPPRSVHKRCLRGSMDEQSSELTADQTAEVNIQVSELKTQVKALQAQVHDKNSQLEEMSTKLLRVEAEVEATSASLRKQLEEARIIAELEHLRTLERVRQDYQVALQREQVLVNCE